MVAMLAALGGHAAPPTVERFDAQTWRALQPAVGEPPLAVVFTTTDCSYCPAVIARLRAALDVRLAAVVMDVAPGDDDAALLADAHYRPADRLLAFDAGRGAALRHGVDPAWRGATPYSVLLLPGRAPLKLLGTPSDAQLAAWRDAAARRP